MINQQPLDLAIIRQRAEWAIRYGSHASDVCEANEEAEQFGRDVLTLLAALSAAREAKREHE